MSLWFLVLNTIIVTESSEAENKEIVEKVRSAYWV